MNKTTAVLVAVIVVLGGSFAWYAANHPDRGPGYIASDDERDGADHRAEPRTLSLDLPAAGLDSVMLGVGVGEVHVTASSDDQVHAKVTLKQKDHEFLGLFRWSQFTAREIAAASIDQHTQDKRLNLSLDYARHDTDDIKQEWDVQIPAHLALKTDMKVGELVIEGVAGGVDARLDVGELSIDAPKGSLHADVNVGEIRATSGSSQHGHIDISSSIGDAVVTVGGKTSGFHEHSGLGNHVSMDGSGSDDMHLSINIGEASLHITPADDAKAGGK